ncbi:MAG: iron-containing alcohol dehydrogenase, partial [Rhodospirillaceae bacterium]|nr:iron-containing alcohol dehydrogenase [Rhodospirillaceae bacterium]
GWVNELLENITAIGIDPVLTTDVSPNPRAAEVMRGADVYSAAHCDGIIAIGGGSVMDCAKGIGIVVSNHRPIEDFEGVDAVGKPCPPLICIPTTAGTSADVSQFAIIRHPTEAVKIAIISKAVVPDLALIDPETTTTMDPFLTACTGIDALVHAIEAFVSSASGPLTDIHALEAIRLVHTHLLGAIHDPKDINLRSAVMMGSLQAGLAFSNASLGAVHAMAHSLGGLLDLPHGQCNALLLEHVIAYNFPEVPDRFLQVGKALNLDLRGCNEAQILRRIFDLIQDFKREAGVIGTLSSCGVKASDIQDLADNAITDACIVTNPRRPERADIETIYAEAL